MSGFFRGAAKTALTVFAVLVVLELLKARDFDPVKGLAQSLSPVGLRDPNGGT